VEAEWLPLGAFELLGLDHEEHSVQREAKDDAERKPADLGTVLRGLRRKKEADEIALIEKCTKACEAGQAKARDILKPGLSEFEIFREVYAEVLRAAGRPCGIYGDFRATTPTLIKAGGLPTSYKLKLGDLFVLDYSVVMDGYRCDFTNTLCVGDPNPQQLKLFNLIEAAQRAGEKTLKAGTPAKDVFHAVNKPISDAGLAANFAHHAGHGIGLGHPEPPILVPDSDDVLIADDVVTLEPGLYVEGIGGMRIEHNYLITDTGYERLSNHMISLY
jgi:Xaa-Pro aminopeptidase